MAACKECKRESDTSLCDTCDRLIDEIYTARAERDALRAEVEAMRGVVEAATYVINNIDLVREAVPGEMALRDALDALRARKVGG